MTAWAVLLLAGVLEIAFATSLEMSRGFARPWPSLATVAFGAAAIILLSRSLQAIPLSTAYAAFTAIGAVGTVAIGIFAFHEPATAARLGCVALVLTGVIGLRLTTPA